jgi:hypothetical protein
MNMFRKTLLLLFLVLAVLSLPSGAKRLTRGFKLAKMRLEFGPQASWETVPKLKEAEVLRILNQPFRYLDKGSQCYAFLSEDGQYVLKLFRFDQRHFLKIDKKTKLEKASRFLDGCKLAYVLAAEETGLLHLHLNQTSHTLPILKARGPLGQRFYLPLDRYRFALQKKASSLEEGLKKALSEGQFIEKVEEIVSLLEQRIGKRIGNTDPSLWRNFGFLENRAIEIDFGNYVWRPDFSEEKPARVEFERYMRSLRSWIEIHAPQYTPDLQTRIDRTRV